MNKERERDEEGARECRTEAAAMTDGAEPCTGSGGGWQGWGGTTGSRHCRAGTSIHVLFFVLFCSCFLFSFCLWR